MSGLVDSSSAHTVPVLPIDVLLGFNLGKGQAKVISGYFGTAETPD